MDEDAGRPAGTAKETGALERLSAALGKVA